MFFYAAKIFWLFAAPLNLALILLLLGLIALVLARRRLAFLAAGAAFAILTLSAWTTLGALLLQPLEDRFARPDEVPESVDGIIVLGGGLESRVNTARGGHELSASGDRFVEAAILARRFPRARVVVSGGSGSILAGEEAEADSIARLLTSLGVERERLILEDRSRDTWENAVYSHELAEPLEGETWLLVTSAFHMPRAVGIFRKVGFPVVPWPADYMTTGTEAPGLGGANVVDALDRTTIAVREWVGLAAYRLVGRTDTLVPAP